MLNSLMSKEKVKKKEKKKQKSKTFSINSIARDGLHIY